MAVPAADARPRGSCWTLHPSHQLAAMRDAPAARRSRRWWLRRSFVPPVIAALAAVGIGAAWRLLWTPAARRFGGTIRAGRPDDYQVGETRHWPEGQFHLVRLSDGFLALYERCPHLGCPIPPPRDGVFECRCHFSRFALNGERLTGPAERPMDLFPVGLSGGALLVRTGVSDVRQRTAYDPGQALQP